MRLEEAVRLVDGGRIVARESQWLMSAAGFAWGPWVLRRRKWTVDDFRRMEERDCNWTPESNPPPIEPTGTWARFIHTLCESWELGPPNEIPGDDWIDVTDRFEDGCPKGYVEYMHGIQSKVG